MWIGHPDRVLPRWIELRTSLLNGRGQDILRGKGWVFNAACVNCGEDDSHRAYEVKKRKQTDAVGDKREVVRFFCDACRFPWKGELKFEPVSRWKKDRPRGNATDARLAEMTSLEFLLGRLDTRQQRIYLILFCHEGVRDYAELAAEANTRWPSMRPPYRGDVRNLSSGWTEWGARQLVAKSREILSQHSLERPAGGPWP